MSLELDWFRFTNHAEQLTHAYIQLAKWPFHWAGELVMDLTKYPIAFLPVCPLVGVHSGWGLGMGAWIFCSIIALGYNFKKGNIG